MYNVMQCNVAGLYSSHIEAMAKAAMTSRAVLKAPTLNTCISDMVGQPSRMRPHTWMYGTVRWLDRFTGASAELAQNVRVPPAWRSLQPHVASNLVKAAVWGRSETSSSACINAWSTYFHDSYVGNPLRHCHNTVRAFPRGPLHGYTLWFNFVRVYFPHPVV
jgi:hypothetical protein